MTISVTARRWRGGWELWVDEERVTQVRLLRNAVQQVIDFLDTEDPDVDHSGWEVLVTPDIPEMSAVTAARQATTAAAAAQEQAAGMMRSAVADLRGSGLSVSDVAAVLGVSRTRVTQLT